MAKKINWRYAIGEVIIVIIGISIAFSLNRYSENLKNRSVKRQYLESLIVDLDAEIDQLQENIEGFNQKLQLVKEVMPVLYGRPGGRDTISQKIFGLANIIHFHPNSITYNTIINSGDLAHLNDFELQKALADHYAYHQVIQLDYERQNKIHEKYFGDFMIYNMDFDKMRAGDYSFLDDPLLKNIVQSLFGTYQIAITASNKGIENCKSLKNLLQTELGD